MVSWKLTNVWIVENTSSNGWNLPLSSYLSGVLLNGMILPLQGWFFPCFSLTLPLSLRHFSDFPAHLSCITMRQGWCHCKGRRSRPAAYCSRSQGYVNWPGAGHGTNLFWPIHKRIQNGDAFSIGVLEGRPLLRNKKWKPPWGPSPNTSLLQAIDAEFFLWDIGQLRCSMYGIFTYTSY